MSGIDLAQDGAIVALCHSGRIRQKIGILELPMPTPAPDGAAWVEAYRHWVG
nr:hypothetical protein [Streptomyces sp. 846.5]